MDWKYVLNVELKVEKLTQCAGESTIVVQNVGEKYTEEVLQRF